MPVGKRWDKRLRERRVFVRHQAGFTDKEIAQTMRMNPKTVRRLLRRVGVDINKQKKGKERKMSNQEWKPNTQAYIERWLEEAAQDGEIDRRAERLGVSYEEAMISLAEELERPYRELEEKYKGEQPTTPETTTTPSTTPVAYDDEEAISLTLETFRNVKEAAVVDLGDAALDQLAQERARERGIPYEVALESILNGEELSA